MVEGLQEFGKALNLTLHIVPWVRPRPGTGGVARDYAGAIIELP